MLGDKPRLDAYKKAILSRKEIFKGMVVMDVGAGTGVLSLFCAAAGAKKVYAVEASSLASVASDVVKENEYSDIIEVLHQKVEDVCLPNGTEVDVIVSEWMGFYLLHESMLDSVIVARDKFLKPNGKLFPDKAIIYVAPCSTPLSLLEEIQKEKEFWDNVAGFKMKSIFRTITRERFSTPEVSTSVQESDLLSSGTKLFTLDLSKVTTNELNLLEARKFISVNRDGEYGGICIWFDCEFPDLNESQSLSASNATAATQKEEDKIILSTSPFSTSTHWKQTLIIWPHTIPNVAIGDSDADHCGVTDQEIKRDLNVDVSNPWKVEDGEVIGFNITLRRDLSYPRRYAIHLEALDPVEEDHPVPCECGTAICTVIGAFLQQNDGSSSSSFSTDGECDVDDS
ncbi:protein arginine N-methyltransferase 6 isoform X2 [Hetaerina americana]